MSRGEAEVALVGILQPINAKAGLRVRPTYTFQQFVELIYLPVWRGKWKLSTGMTEEQRLKAHLVTALGQQLMHEISRKELQCLLDLKSTNLARSMIDHLRFRLRSIFQLAVSEGVVDRNPAVSLYTPRTCKSGRERLILTADEALQMIEALELREKLIVRLATWEGMRPGEILGLQVGDIGSDSISIRRRVYRGNVDSPKTRRSIREVALTNGTAGLVGKWIGILQNRQPKAWLFPSETQTTPLSRDNLWRRNLLPKLKEIGLEWATFHVMRRTFATLSKHAGVDAHTRSAQMGNTVDVNENEYAFSRLQDKLAAVRKLENTISGHSVKDDQENLRLGSSEELGEIG
jgi:integrase